MVHAEKEGYHMKKKRLQLTLDNEIITDLKLYSLILGVSTAELVVDLIRNAEERGYLIKSKLDLVKTHMADVQKFI